MPANTPDKAFPYPLGSDRLMDGDDAIHALALAVDNSIQSGSVTLTTIADTNVIVPVVFAHPFAALPIVVVGSLSGPPGGNYSNVYWGQAVTAAGFSIGAKRSTAVAVTVPWIAIGRLV